MCSAGYTLAVLCKRAFAAYVYLIKKGYSHVSVHREVHWPVFELSKLIVGSLEMNRIETQGIIVHMFCFP